MAFESLSEKFQQILKGIRGQTRLSEANMDAMLKEIRVALLEADVNFKVVKEFLGAIKEKAIGQQVFEKLNPGQTVVKIVRDELVVLLGSDQAEIHYQANRPTVLMLVGLQGSGKTTTAGKLAKYMKDKLHKKVLLAACDIYRPAAIDQLATIAGQVGVDIVTMGTGTSPVTIAEKAREKAFNEHYDALIIDTAGRLHIDDALMGELNAIAAQVKPDETLLLVDAMSGQDAVNVATAFHAKVPLSGVIMSKLDGDARGGAALSIRHLTGIPIKLTGVGEKLGDIEPFYPDRMAERILGMGDVLTLIEKAQETLDEKEAKKSAQKMMSGKFTLEDMLAQMKQMQKLGSLGGLLKMIPGMPKISPEQQAQAEKDMKLFESVIHSMTPEERRDPDILKNSRKVRIAKGSGTTQADVNRVIKKWEQSREMMKQLASYQKSGKMPGGMGGFPFR